MSSCYACLVGTGGIGSGDFFELEGHHTLGRNESRGARLRNFHDFCKGHIILHYPAKLLGKKFKVVLAGAVGKDRAGQDLLGLMKKAGIDTSCVKTIPGVPTLFSTCFLYPDRSGGNITTKDSASSRVTPKDMQALLSVFKKYTGRGLALAAPEVPIAARMRLLTLAQQYRFFRIAAITSGEARQALRMRMFSKTDLVCLNEDEASALAGVSAKAKVSRVLHRTAGLLRKFNPAVRISVTLGSKGAYGYEAGGWQFFPSFKVKAVNSAGAGDAFVSGLIIGLAKGLPFLNKGQADKRTVASAMGLATLLASAKVKSTDTIDLGLTAKGLKKHAKTLKIKLSPRLF